jgi:transcriptional regulator with GAF, ATPase, and Fis domain
VLVSLKDASGVAQVDETRASVFLKQGHIADAERVARAAVRAHEKSDNHALLAEALITHGRALARLRNYSVSLSAFRRSIELSEHTGNLNRAADAALAAFQELGDHLAISEGRKLVSGRRIGDEKRSFEHEAIKRALENSKGSVTRAARSLGMSWQALSYMLNNSIRRLAQISDSSSAEASTEIVRAALSRRLK